jgi:hypothetical protein
MKNKMNIAIIIGIVVIVIGVGGYAGYTKFFNTANQGVQKGTKAGSKQQAPAAMTTAYSTVLKALVTEKTITQAQSDKVLVAVTANMRGGRAGGGEKKPTGSGSVDEQKPNDETQTDKSKPKNDRLSELVTSEVITQVQADTINQKLQEAIKTDQTTTAKQ